jgi:hypothetical protein
MAIGDFFKAGGAGLEKVARQNLTPEPLGLLYQWVVLTQKKKSDTSFHYQNAKHQRRCSDNLL